MRRRLGGGAWSPANESTLELWLSADTLGLADGAAVATWSDRSGRGRHATQATGGKRPVLKTAVLNNQPVVRFDGAASQMATASFALTDPFTVFLVLAQKAWTSAARLWMDASADQATIRQFGGAGSPNIQIASTAPLNNASLSVGTYGLLTGVFNGSNSSLQVNSLSLVTGNDAGFGGIANGISLGAKFDGTLCAQVDIAEVICFSSVSSSLVDKAKVYVARKYGIA